MSCLTLQMNLENRAYLKGYGYVVLLLWAFLAGFRNNNYTIVLVKKKKKEKLIIWICLGFFVP